MDSRNKKESYIIDRATSLKHAIRGVAVFFRITKNSWFHLFTLAVVVCLGLFFGISQTDWIFIVLANGAVFTVEAINSAIEIDMDLTNPTIHPMVRDTKDIAAGAVLIIGVTAWIVEIFIFLPKIISMFS